MPEESKEELTPRWWGKEGLSASFRLPPPLLILRIFVLEGLEQSNDQPPADCGLLCDNDNLSISALSTSM